MIFKCSFNVVFFLGYEIGKDFVVNVIDVVFVVGYVLYDIFVCNELYLLE